MKTSQHSQARILGFLCWVSTLSLTLTLIPEKSYSAGTPPPPCNEQGPHWGRWSGSCPSIITNGSVSPTSIAQCGVTAPMQPTNIVAPVYSSELWQQTGTYDCTNTVSTNTETISYSVGTNQWDPPLPALVTNIFSSTVYANVTSSDTTNCASPGRVNIGTVTWSLPCPTINDLTIDRCGEVIPPVLEDGVLRPVYGAVVHYHFQCADGWYSWETNLITQNCDTTDHTLYQLTTATNVPWYDYGADGKGGDGVASTVVSPSAMPCTMVSQQTIFFAPVGGGSVTNNNSTCSFNFTRTLTIVADENNPHHANITLVVSGLANSVTNQCSL